MDFYPNTNPALLHRGIIVAGTSYNWIVLGIGQQQLDGN